MWTVPREWVGETAFILGGGPSLRKFDGSVLKDRNVICVNNSWELLPTADYLLFHDLKFWDHMSPKDPALHGYPSNGDAIKQHFRGSVVSIGEDVTDPFVKKLRNTGRTGLETEPTGLRHGSNSGYQSMGLAYLLGASKIVLLGFDMHVNGGTHWHSGHGRDAAEVAHRLSKTFIPHFKALVQPLASAGVEVINATPGSALPYWKYSPLEKVLCSS